MWNIQLWFLFPRDAQLKFNCVLVCRTGSGLVVLLFFFYSLCCLSESWPLSGFSLSSVWIFSLGVHTILFSRRVSGFLFGFWQNEIPVQIRISVLCVEFHWMESTSKRAKKNNANDIYNESECLCHQANDQRHGKWWVVDLNFLLFVAKMIDTLQSVKW